MRQLIGFYILVSLINNAVWAVSDDFTWKEKIAAMAAVEVFFALLFIAAYLIAGER